MHWNLCKKWMRRTNENRGNDFHCKLTCHASIKMCGKIFAKSLTCVDHVSSLVVFIDSSQYIFSKYQLFRILKKFTIKIIWVLKLYWDLHKKWMTRINENRKNNFHCKFTCHISIRMSGKIFSESLTCVSLVFSLVVFIDYRFSYILEIKN